MNPYTPVLGRVDAVRVYWRLWWHPYWRKYESPDWLTGRGYGRVYRPIRGAAMSCE